MQIIFTYNSYIIIFFRFLNYQFCYHQQGVSASEEKINSLKAMFGDVNLNLSASTELLAKLKHHENTVETTNANLASESARFATMIPSLMEQCHATNAELEIVNLSKLNTTDNIKNLNARKARILALSHKIDVDTFALEREISICHSANSSKSAVLIAINEESMTGEADLREKERIIDMYQSSLKQRNELVEKKVSQSEYLRKKFTAIIEESRGAENLDTFDNRLKNLETVVDQVIEDCNRLENSWLSSQTELVSLVHESEECLSQKRLLKAKACVLKQQKQRLLGYLVDCNADIKHSKQSSEKLQQEISKLNCSFSLHKEKVLDIQSKCFSSKRSHEDKLDELYGLLKEMNDRAVQVRDMTQDLLQETSQLNESTSRCESNIQSTKTIRASNALDNTVETDDLDLDLRNISQRLDSARRFQNSLCNAIENVVLKRKEITNSFTSSSLASDNRPASKRLASLTSDIAEIASKSTKAYEMFRSKVLVIEGVEKQLVSLKPLIHSSMSKAQILVDTVAYKKVEVRILQSTNSSKLQYLSNLLSKRGKNMKRTRSHNGQLLSNVKVAVKEIRDNCCHSNAVVSSLDTLSGAVNL